MNISGISNTHTYMAGITHIQNTPTNTHPNMHTHQKIYKTQYFEIGPNASSFYFQKLDVFMPRW